MSKMVKYAYKVGEEDSLTIISQTNDGLISEVFCGNRMLNRGKINKDDADFYIVSLFHLHPETKMKE